MMIVRIPWLLTALLAASALSLAEEEGVPVDPEQLRREQQQQMEQELAPLPNLGTRSLREIIRFSIEEGEVVLGTRLPQSARSRILIEEVPGFTIVYVDGKAAGADPRSFRQFQLLHYDFARPEAILVQTHILASPGYLQVARDVQFMGDEVTSVSLIQNRHVEGGGDEDVRLFISSSGASGIGPLRMNLMGPSLTALQRQYPQEVGDWLQPIFRELHQEAELFAVEREVAWQIFMGAFEPDEQLGATVRRLVARLDADSFQEREAAVQELRELGQPAALLLMHMDRSDLSAEQNTRIDTFLADYQPLANDQAQRLRSSPHFLLNCLYINDRTIRAESLAELGRLFEREIEFDLEAQGDALIAAVVALREELAPSPLQLDRPAEPTESEDQ